jgi:hypothetical protein
VGGAEFAPLKVEYVAVDLLCLAGTALRGEDVGEIAAGGEHEESTVFHDRFQVQQEILELASGGRPVSPGRHGSGESGSCGQGERVLDAQHSLLDFEQLPAHVFGLAVAALLV